MKEEKTEKKKKSLWKKLLTAAIILCIIGLIFHFAFGYFSNVICENLSSIAESEQYVTKGNEKIEIGTYYDNIDTLLTESAELSKLAYDPDEGEQDRTEALKKLGYDNIQQYQNKPSQLYKRLSKKNKKASAMMSAVNVTVATKKTKSGDTMVAIAFKGTDSSNINDDLSDMYKAVNKEGFHEGFMFNAKQFYKKSDKIKFVIDGEAVSLKDILENAKQKDSKYKILVTGHSLGAAVADIYSGYILKNESIDNSNIVTITYGTPKSCSKDYKYNGNNIINVINTDDMVPTIGAEAHLGNCLYFTPSNSFRKVSYGDHYVEPNAYNSYSDLLKTAESGLIAHNMDCSYKPAIKEIEKNHDKYFIHKN